ncbi:MFS transporter [Tellurirhabdus bombi]|uniref:MFS transporter n=1 Tax=Tellurirhabdus bombi TaxID=2907205 RepID=UPI001F33D271|nr:MFS transporter [Tellurirhabdus bombi]
MMVESVEKVTPKRTGYKWELLALLWLAFFLNQADRQIFSVVLPLIRDDLKLTDAELGLIASALVWTYGLLVPVAGFIGDRLSRRSIIGFSLLFWSLSTMATGFCTTLLQFIVLRGIATGGGEAFYAPSANALLSEHHTKSRSFALSLHQTAVYAGIILSGLIAGYIGEHYGWRRAFFLFGGFGILVGLVIFARLLKDRPIRTEIQPSIWQTAGSIARKPTALLLTLAFACMVFVNVGYLTWMPSFLAEKFGLSLAAAGFSSLFYHHIGAAIGVLLGGKLTDRLALRNPVSRLWMQAGALLLAAPFIYFMSTAAGETATYTALFLFGIFRGIYDANIFASLYEVVRPAIRSSASGLMLMCAFLAGAFSPYLLGILKPIVGLTAGLSGLSISYVVGATAIALAALVFFKRDRAVQD